MALAIVAACAFPAAAHATLAYVKNPLKPAVWIAEDDGSGKRRVAAGGLPHVSPDGQMVSYFRQQKAHKYRPELMVVPAAGGAPRRLLAGWREPFVFDWSPDSTTIAVLGGPELGKKSLLLIDVASGARRTIARGYISAVSFAPEGGRLVYSKAAGERFPPRGDVYRFDLATGKTVRLTRDRRSLNPLWGPSGRIAFVKLLGEKRRRYGPKYELFLMDANGRRVRRLTRTKVGALLLGLTPTQWSANGTRLLAEFVGQDTSYAVAVNAQTGGQRAVAGTGARGFVGAALAADGRTVLGATGGVEPGPGHNVVTVPYGGGKARILARNAYEPDWDR